jgi:hypothetical protein
LAEDEFNDLAAADQKTTAYLKLAFLLYLTYFTFVVVTGKLETINAFIHNVDLPIHEFGHPFFGLLFGGGIMMYAGGNLFQFIFPCILAGSFFFRKDFFGAAICSLWAGETLIDAAYYISDASTRELPLITGDIDSHDWFNIFSELNILHLDKTIGKLVFFSGSLLMISSLIVAFYLANKEGKFVEINK